MYLIDCIVYGALLGDAASYDHNHVLEEGSCSMYSIGRFESLTQNKSKNT